MVLIPASSAPHPQQDSSHYDGPDDDPQKIDLRGADVRSAYAVRGSVNRFDCGRIQPLVKIESATKGSGESWHMDSSAWIDPLECVFEGQIEAAGGIADQVRSVLFSAVPDRHGPGLCPARALNSIAEQRQDCQGRQNGEGRPEPHG